MPFIIKNVRHYKVKVGRVTLLPGEQLTGHELNDAINDAADRGDITVTDSTLTAAERKADVDAIQQGIDKMGKIVGDK